MHDALIIDICAGAAPGVVSFAYNDVGPDLPASQSHLGMIYSYIRGV